MGTVAYREAWQRAIRDALVTRGPRPPRARLLLGALTLGVFGCGDPECSEVFYGGGNATIELRGDIEGTFEVPGFTRKQLREFAKLYDPYAGVPQTAPTTGAGFVELGDGGWTARAATILEEGSLEGCAGASRLVVEIDGSSNEGRIVLGAGQDPDILATNLLESNGTRNGSGNFRFEGFVPGAQCFVPGVEVEVILKWSFETRPKLRHAEQCPGGWGL